MCRVLWGAGPGLGSVWAGSTGLRWPGTPAPLVARSCTNCIKQCIVKLIRCQGEKHPTGCCESRYCIKVEMILEMLEILWKMIFFVGQRPSAPLVAWDHTSLGRHSGPRQSSVSARPHPGPEWPDISERPEQTWSPTSDVRLTSGWPETTGQEAGDTTHRRRWGSALSEVSAWQVLWHHVTEGNECREAQLSSAAHCSGDLRDRETTLALAIIQCQLTITSLLTITPRHTRVVGVTMNGLLIFPRVEEQWQ